jgi:transposase-like protein
VELQNEVCALVGSRYRRGGPFSRWGFNEGAVYLGDQKVPVAVPRVVRKSTREFVSLGSYQRLQDTGRIDDMALRRVIRGISMGNYEGAALSIPETFGIKRDSVSRRWIRASSRKLKEFQERSLSELDLVVLILDGKWFGDNEMILACGITIHGRKVLLGMIEASTERYEVCRDFLNGMVGRGLKTDKDVLVVIDGGKGLRKAVDVVIGERAHVQRCQLHKRENVVGYLPKGRQEEFRHKLQGAYETPGYEAAKEKLIHIRAELKPLNLSAVNSLNDGLEETLTLHRLGLFVELGQSLKTTNILENINGLLERKTNRVTRWTSSDQRQRWVATALMEIEPRLRTIRGHRHLPALRTAMGSARIKIQAASLTKAA